MKTRPALALLCLAATLLGCSRDPQLLTVQPERLELRLRASGQLESVDSVRLGPPPVQGRWNFTISMIGEEGSQVRAGQPVLGFDPGDLRDRLQNARNELAEKQQELERVRQANAQARERERLDAAERIAQLERSERKADQPAELIAAIEWQKLHAERELNAYIVAQQQRRDALTERVRANEEAVIQADIDRLAAEVRQFEEAIARMTLRAPRDGVLIVRSDWRGDRFARNSQVFMGQPVVEIPNLEAMVARVQVPEREAAQVQRGQLARVTLDADPGRVFLARVVEVNRVLRPRSRQVPAMVVDVDLAIDEPDPEIMRPGMAVRAEIVTAVREDALLVPARSVRHEHGQPMLELRRGASTRRVPVRLGPRDEDRVLVLEGLSAGDRVLVR